MRLISMMTVLAAQLFLFSPVAAADNDKVSFHIMVSECTSDGMTETRPGGQYTMQHAALELTSDDFNNGFYEETLTNPEYPGSSLLVNIRKFTIEGVLRYAVIARHIESRAVDSNTFNHSSFFQAGIAGVCNEPSDVGKVNIAMFKHE